MQIEEAIPASLAATEDVAMAAQGILGAPLSQLTCQLIEEQLHVMELNGARREEIDHLRQAFFKLMAQLWTEDPDMRASANDLLPRLQDK